MNIKYPQAVLSRTISQTAKGFNVILKSDVVVRDVLLQTIKKDAIFSDNNFFMLPGKRYKIHVQYVGTKEELDEDLIINSINNCYFQK